MMLWCPAFLLFYIITIAHHETLTQLEYEHYFLSINATHSFHWKCSENWVDIYLTLMAVFVRSNLTTWGKLIWPLDMQLRPVKPEKELQHLIISFQPPTLIDSASLVQRDTAVKRVLMNFSLKCNIDSRDFIESACALQSHVVPPAVHLTLSVYRRVDQLTQHLS